MPWIISFVISWIIFFILVDYRQLKRTIFGGLLALVLGTAVDWGAQKLHLYGFRQVVISFFDCPIFYKFGPIAVIGILFVQYLPRKRLMQALNVLMCSLLFAALEYLSVRIGVLYYINWHIAASFVVDLLIFATMTWVSSSFIRHRNQ